MIHGTGGRGMNTRKEVLPLVALIAAATLDRGTHALLLLLLLLLP